MKLSESQQRKLFRHMVALAKDVGYDDLYDVLADEDGKADFSLLDEAMDVANAATISIRFNN